MPFMSKKPTSGSIWKPKYRKPDGTLAESRLWWITYWVDGKRRRESAKTESWEEANRKLKFKNGEAVTGRSLSPESVTMSTLFDDLIQDYIINKRKSLYEMKLRLEAHVRPVFGALRAVDVTAERAKRYVAMRRAAEAANATINRELSIVRSALTAAVKVALQRPERKPRGPYKKRTRPNPPSCKKGTGATAELSRILWLRADGWTLKRIGAEIGVTRERIRQILKRNSIVGRLKHEKPHRIVNFRFVMRKWLYWAGFRYCNICDTWKDSCSFSPKVQHTCRKCNTARQNDRTRTNPKAKEYRLQYAKGEKSKQYQREYAKRPEVKQRLKMQRVKVAHSTEQTEVTAALSNPSTDAL